MLPLLLQAALALAGRASTVEADSLEGYLFPETYTYTSSTTARQLLRTMVEQSLERAVQHIESLPQQPAASVEGARALARRLAESLPWIATRPDSNS